MICSGKPERFIAAHAFITCEDILQRFIKCMPHVQLPRNIWRRNNDSERFFIFVYIGSEIPVADPEIIYTVFNVARIVIFFQFFFHRCYLLLSILYNFDLDKRFFSFSDYFAVYLVFCK